MSQMSDYLEDKLISHVFLGTAFTMPAARYISLHSADPTDAGTGTEISGGSYARVSAPFSALSNGMVQNSGDVPFPLATGSWGSITHFGVWDALTGGNLLVFGAFTGTPKIVEIDDQYIIKATKLTVQFT